MQSRKNEFAKQRIRFWRSLFLRDCFSLQPINNQIRAFHTHRRFVPTRAIGKRTNQRSQQLRYRSEHYRSQTVCSNRAFARRSGSSVEYYKQPKRNRKRIYRKRSAIRTRANRKMMEYDPRLKHPFTGMVVGPTQCGKTTLVLNLIERADEAIVPSSERFI